MIRFFYLLLSLPLLYAPLQAGTTTLSTPPTITLPSAPATFVMLAHRWEAQQGYLDLRLDGTFEGSLDGEEIYYGLWSLDDDERVMTLTNDPMDEEEFEWNFDVLELSFDALHLRLNQEQTWALQLAD